MTTITEALAEIKTIDKRLAKKQEFITNYLARQEKVRDPLAKDGGSFQAIQREVQSVEDLMSRQVELRRAIHKANSATLVRIGNKELTIAEWIIWKREVAPKLKSFYGGLSARLASLRQDIQKKGLQAAASRTDAAPDEIIIELDEKALAQKIESLEEVLGSLDGQLSMKNATVTI